MPDADVELDTFAAQVRERHDRFQDSARTIVKFVTDTRKSVSELIQRNADVLRRLKGETDPDVDASDPETDDDDEGVEITEEMATYLERLMADHAVMLDRYPTILFEMAFIYFVATFEAYMQDVVEITLRSRPDILKSNKQMPVERVVELYQRGALIPFLAEREVTELGYRSFRDQAEYYRDKFKLEIAATADLDELVEYHARRNLYVHNGGFVNARYLEAVPEAQVAVGHRVELTEAYWDEAHVTLTRVAAHVRDHLVRKYGRRVRTAGA